MASLKETKKKVLEVLANQSPLLTEEIQDILSGVPEDIITEALEALEREEKVTANRASQMLLTESYLSNLSKRNVV